MHQEGLSRIIDGVNDCAAFARNLHVPGCVVTRQGFPAACGGRTRIGIDWVKGMMLLADGKYIRPSKETRVLAILDSLAQDSGLSQFELGRKLKLSGARSIST